MEHGLEKVIQAATAGGLLGFQVADLAHANGKPALEVQRRQPKSELFDSEESQFPNCNLPGMCANLLLNIICPEKAAQEHGVINVRPFRDKLCGIFG